MEGEEINKKHIYCKECGSSQIRTTKDFRICIRCGYKEKVK